MQLDLFGRDLPRFDPAFPGVRRIELGQGAWLEHVPGLVRGHIRLFDELRGTLRWRAQTRRMYERIVAVPRLFASMPDDGPVPGPVQALGWALDARYGASFSSVTAALYRDGDDSVAWHRDREVRDCPLGFVVTLSLGEPRPFVVRPRGGGRSRTFRLGCGDLMVMGGSCQVHHEHAVPKVRAAGPRMSVMFRERRITPGAPIDVLAPALGVG